MRLSGALFRLKISSLLARPGRAGSTAPFRAWLNGKTRRESLMRAVSTHEVSEGTVHISVSHTLRPTFDGNVIEEAPSVSALHEMIGRPSRIQEGKTPAPVGHRNNQAHIYGGVCFLEHHYTRRIGDCEILFDANCQIARARGMSQPFDGCLDIAGHALTSTTDLREFFRACPVVFSSTVLGWLRAEQDGLSAIITLERVRFPSGRRSKALRLVSLSLTWPHDPWDEPATG